MRKEKRRKEKKKCLSIFKQYFSTKTWINSITTAITKTVKSPGLFFPEIAEEKNENDNNNGEEKKNEHPHKILTNVMKKKMIAVGAVENQLQRNKEYTNIGFVLDYVTTKRPMTIPVCEISIFKKDDPNNISVEFTSPPAILKDESYVWEKIQVL